MQNIISVVTPSFNQGEFIGDTIKSILKQKGDFYIDYVIIDGGSTDCSTKIIADFENELKLNCVIQKYFDQNFYISKQNFKLNQCKGISYRWISEKDEGHAHALNKGFEMTIGNIMCWLNSDDMYHENAFQTVFEVFNKFSKVKWITGLNTIWKKDGSQLKLTFLGKHNYKNIFSFLTKDYEWIQQETTFWKRELWNHAGAKINTQYKYMVDGELWCRFFLYEEIFHVNRELGGYRKHDSNRALKNIEKVKEELDQAVKFLEENVSEKIKTIATNITSNDKIETTDYSSANFKIIDKKDSDDDWQIREVDFLQYRIKRYAAQIRKYENAISDSIDNESESNSLLRKKIQEKDSLIKQILNSRRYRLGTFLLAPFSITSSSIRKLRLFAGYFYRIFRLILQIKTWKIYFQLIRINWQTITKFDLYSFTANNNPNRLVKSAIKGILSIDLDMPSKVDTRFLFIKTMIRQDYNEYFNKVYEQCSYEKEKSDIQLNFVQKPSYFKIIKVLVYLPIFFKIKGIDLRSKLYMYFKAISYISVINVASKYNINVLIAFADMQPIENLLIQFFKKNGKQTITMQHGLYVDYTSFENINKVNYENVVSDHFLAWGNETRELIQKYHPNAKITVCGKPIYLTPPKEKEPHFTVVFDQNIFKEQNRELIAIANEIARHIGLQINVRLHPWNNKAEYEFDEDICVFDRSIESSQFVIGHTTSMIFECMRSGIPAYKYRTEIPANVIDERLKFSNADELLQCLENTKGFDFVEAGKYYLQYIGEESLEQYRRFFDRLMEDNMCNQIH
jgi:glycosyltransferase involved in cell wall biosynthesis